MERLEISGNNVDDEAVAAYAHSLTNNGSLITLSMLGIQQLSNGISSPIVESAFSKLLCDTSSVNVTFLSNHIIENFIFSLRSTDQSLEQLKQVNRMEDKKEVAMIKILLSHDDLDMLPFFEWEFKVLPLMIDWFERAAAITMPNGRNIGRRKLGRRKLSSIYQFVRGMPLLYVEARLRKELEDIKAAELHLEEEKRRVALLQERKRSIIEKLGLPSS